MGDVRIANLIRELANRMGIDAFLDLCQNLMGGADRNHFVEELRYLTGHAWNAGDSMFNESSWPDYWIRTWGARGLLHVWDDRGTDAIVAGLGDPHWRPAEMCLKVVACYDVAGAAEAACLLLHHPLPRVRIHALRALAVVGDTADIEAVLSLRRDGRVDVSLQALRSAEAMAMRLDCPLAPIAIEPNRR